MGRTSTPEEIRQRFPNGPKRRSPIPYAHQYYAAVAVFVATLVTGAILLAGPTELGLPPVAARWIGVAATVLAGLAGVLPKIQSPPDGRPE